MPKAIIIFSGGMDSVTLLKYLQENKYELYGLSFDYGQRHRKELEFAAKWGKALCTEWKCIQLDFMRELANNSALTGSKDVPHEHYAHENQKQTVVPNRNMVMLSIAIAWAENLGIREVYFAPHANDHAIYPDCRPEFTQAMDKAAQEATYHKVCIFAPFVHLKKSDIAQIGLKFGLDYSQTWSCYEGREKHCGKCGTCQERKEAFAEIGIKDPTEYEV